MNEVKVVHQLPADWGNGDACLVALDMPARTQYFVVSSVDALITGPETLAFRADADGEVSSWTEVAGGRGMSREEVIDELREMFSA